MSAAAKLRFPPGPSTGLKRWSLGPLNNGDPLRYFTEIVREYGDFVGLHILNFRILLINHPDQIEDVLVNHPRKFVKGRVLQANKRVFGKGLLTSEGEFWLRQRRLVQPAFHRARIAGYASTMVEYAERLVCEWQDGEERDIHKEMMRLTLQIVGKTLFDADVEGDAQDVGKSLELLLKLGANFRRTIFIPQWLPTPTNLRLERAIRQIEKVLYRIIAEKRSSGRDAGDLLSMLLAAQDEDGSHMNDRQLRDEAITLFLAGHETTANALSWTWWLLAQNHAAEAKLHAELRTVLAGRAPSLDDLPKLVYTNHIITESMRLYPPAWGTARTAIEDHEIAGYAIPKGSGVSF
ncbi:MAG: cytochrome P450, partial [Candidatus Acidiferrum sp.]